MIEINRNNTALLIIDAQKGFTELCPDELPVPGALKIVGEISKYLNNEMTLVRYLIGSKDAHSPNAIWVANEKQPQFTKLDYPNADMAWNLHCVPGTKGYELIDGLPDETTFDYFIWKGISPDLHPYSACYADLKKELSTGLIEYLQLHSIENVICVGLATEYCVLNTVVDLREFGFRVIVDLAGCAGITKEGVEVAIVKMKEKRVNVINDISEIEFYED